MRRFLSFSLFISLIAFTASLSPSPLWAKSAPKAKKPAAAASSSGFTPSEAAHPVFERDGSFGFCLGDFPMPDGRKLTIARSPRDEVNLGISIPKAGFQAGHKYDLTLSLDDAKIKTIRAVALGPDDLLLQLGADDSFRKPFQTSEILTLAASGNKIVFQLPPMKKTWGDLGACLKASKGKVNEAVRKAEEAMPETLKALLVTAGIQDIVPLSMEKIPPADRPADFVWEMDKGKVTGGVRERMAPEGKNLEALTGLHIDGLKKRCTGTFKADVGREQEVPGLKNRLAQVSCAMKDGDKEEKLFVAMYFYLTAKGRFTVFSFETDDANKQLAIDASKAVSNTLVDFARQAVQKQKEGQ